MIDAVRRLVVRAASPIVWRLPGHAAGKLESFSRAEEGSRVDLLAAAHATPSPARRAQYLRHALDETRHARLFARRAGELRLARGQLPAGPPRADSEALFARLGEVGFLAFVHLGERRGREQFAIYARLFARHGDERTRALFEGVLADEVVHERYTRELLVELCGEAGARRALRRARRWQLWRTWRRAGRALAGATYTIAMLAVYVVSAPLGWLAARLRARRARQRWLGSG